HELPLGERTVHYFHRDRAEEVREALGLPRKEDSTARERFLAFLGKMDMFLSYKPVMLLALLNEADKDGKARTACVARRFRQFYRDRRTEGLLVERPGSRKHPIDELDDGEVQRLM